MTEAQPEIRCYDFWPNGITRPKLRAYETMIKAGQITKPKVVINKSTGSMAVSYASTIPQEWIREEMGKIAREGIQEEMGGTNQ